MNKTIKCSLVAVGFCILSAYWGGGPFVLTVHADDEEWEMTEEDKAWYDASSRVHMFQLFIKRMNWAKAAETLAHDYLETCGGTPNGLGSVVVRDLGSRPVKLGRPGPDDIEATADEASVETFIELQDGSRVQLRYAVEQFAPGPHGWGITEIRLEHRDEQWTMCHETPAFARKTDAGSPADSASGDGS